MIRCARGGRKWAPRRFLYQTVAGHRSKTETELVSTNRFVYTERERERGEGGGGDDEETFRVGDADRACPATTRRSRNIRGRNVARISALSSYTTAVGVIIVHGVETCQQQQRYPRRETKGSFHRGKREESFIPSWTNLRRPTIPDPRV